MDLTTRKTRTARKLDFNGKSLTIAEWSKELSISVAVLYNRLHAGWSIERMLTQPQWKKGDPRSNSPSDPVARADGKKLTSYLRDRAKGEPVRSAIQILGDEPEFPLPIRNLTPIPKGLETCDESEAMEMDGGLKLGIANDAESPDAFAAGSSVRFLRLATFKNEVSVHRHRPIPTDARNELLEDLYELDEHIAKLTSKRVVLLVKLGQK